MMLHTSTKIAVFSRIQLISGLAYYAPLKN